MSFNPCISHYRRQHAPNQLYLPSKLSKKYMHVDFNAKHPNEPCSYITYTRFVKKLHISFGKLGEECEACLRLTEAIHDRTDDTFTPACRVCLDKAKHTWIRILKSSAGVWTGFLWSTAWQDHAQCRSTKSDHASVSTWCQICMLRQENYSFQPNVRPRESISYPKNTETLCMLSYEGLAGRKCQEIINFIDNCVGQNKNWSLVTATVKLINSDP